MINLTEQPLFYGWRGREIRKGGKTKGCKVGEIKQFGENEESKRGRRESNQGLPVNFRMRMSQESPFSFQKYLSSWEKNEYTSQGVTLLAFAVLRLLSSTEN